MNRNPTPRGPFSGPPNARSTVHPTGGTLTENRARPYVPSWAAGPRTTWANVLGGHYGLCGGLAGALPPAGATVRATVAKAAGSAA